MNILLATIEYLDLVLKIIQHSAVDGILHWLQQTWRTRTALNFGGTLKQRCGSMYSKIEFLEAL